MKSSELSLELARSTDAATIAGMSRVLIEYGFRWSWTPERVAANILAPNVNVLVARLHEQTAGFAIMSYGDYIAHLLLLGVARPYRRLGIGRQLLEWLEKCAAVAGIICVSLEVRSRNKGAQKFYHRMGYRPLVRLPGYYQGREAALRMGKDLTRKPQALL